MIKIHQVKTRLVNSYIVEYPNKLMVMDIATRNHKYVLNYIEKTLQRSLHDVQLVICSHDDPDHIGGLAAFAHLTHAKIAIPYASHSTWRKLCHDPSGFVTRFFTSLRELLRTRAWDMYFNPARNKAFQQQAAGYPQHYTAEPAIKLQIDFRLKHLRHLPGFEDWQIIHTPGHSWDSCCFYHASSNSLLSGDTLLGSAKHNKLFTPAIYANRRDILSSLKYLKQLNIKTVYPGHGSIISGEGIISHAQLQ